MSRARRDVVRVREGLIFRSLMAQLLLLSRLKEIPSQGLIVQAWRGGRGR